MRPTMISPLTARTLSQSVIATGETIGSGTRVRADTSGGAFALLAPSTLYPDPETAAFIVEDSGNNAETNPITVDGNGRTIDGEASYEIAVNGAAVLFLYDQDEDEWRVGILPRSDPNAELTFFLASDLRSVL